MDNNEHGTPAEELPVDEDLVNLLRWQPIHGDDPPARPHWMRRDEVVGL